jgi:DNA polymerase (family 10)
VCGREGYRRTEAEATVSKARPTNDDIADVLERVADLLETQEANPHRIRAYRTGARTMREWRQSVADLLDDQGVEGLEDLPGIGKGLARSIREYVRTGRLLLLDRLEGQVSPEDLFCTVPGIGEEFAKRIHAQLEIDTLEDLELAAYDGRLEEVPGFGTRRVQAVRAAIASILSRSARRRARRAELVASQPAPGQGPGPGVDLLLDVDGEYRRRAGSGQLRTIAPRRFNPEGKSWLPILHTERGAWAFTALFSNTARAHELGTTRDWVVVYYEHDHHEGQCTVVTERGGPLAGKRVVRGRESECREYYAGRGE